MARVSPAGQSRRKPSPFAQDRGHSGDVPRVARGVVNDDARERAISFCVSLGVVTENALRWVGRGCSFPIVRTVRQPADLPVLYIDIRPIAKRVRDWVMRVSGLIRLLVVGLVLGWLYGAVSPRLYPEGKPLGFFYGMLHGGFMPMALPALLMGSDVSIYAAGADGRRYKLGYIAGINVCGLVFFGSAFWRPQRRARGSPAG